MYIIKQTPTYTYLCKLYWWAEKSPYILHLFLMWMCRMNTVSPVAHIQQFVCFTSTCSYYVLLYIMYCARSHTHACQVAWQMLNARFDTFLYTHWQYICVRPMYIYFSMYWCQFIRNCSFLHANRPNSHSILLLIGKNVRSYVHKWKFMFMMTFYPKKAIKWFQWNYCIRFSLCCGNINQHCVDSRSF